MRSLTYAAGNCCVPGFHYNLIDLIEYFRSKQWYIILESLQGIDVVSIKSSVTKHLT